MTDAERMMASDVQNSTRVTNGGGEQKDPHVAKLQRARAAVIRGMTPDLADLAGLSFDELNAVHGTIRPYEGGDSSTVVRAAEGAGTDPLLISGDEAFHYRALRAAAKAAHDAQNEMARTGVELRDAFARLCKAIEP